MRSSTRTSSAGTTVSLLPSSTRAVWGVRCTSFSIPALAFATVRSSSSAPSCMMKATSPAAKSSRMHTDAMSARETRTSALMSKEVTRPMIASRIMGMPHKTMATHAISKGRDINPNRLFSRLRISETPPSASRAMSFFVPPHSKNSSSFSICFFMGDLLVCTNRGIAIIYPHGYAVNRKNGSHSTAVQDESWAYCILAKRSMALVKLLISSVSPRSMASRMQWLM